MICCSNCFSWITNIYILDFFMLTIIIQIYKENTMAPRKSASKTKSSSKPKSAAAKAAAKKRASKSSTVSASYPDAERTPFSTPRPDDASPPPPMPVRSSLSTASRRWMTSVPSAQLS